MKISKTRFINYIRCPRFVALEEIHRNKNEALVSFTEEMDDLMSEENQYKINILKDDMYDENDEDLLEKVDPQQETLQKYYDYLETVSGRLIEEKFPGDIVYNLETQKQKRFELEDQGYYFYCFLDGYQEDEKNIRIFETKATTNKKLLNMTYIDEDKEKKPMFEYSPDGILMPAEMIYDQLPENYYKKRASFFDRLNAMGRYVYDLAYQRYVISKSLQKDNINKQEKYYLVLLNSEYVHDGKTDEHQEPIYPTDLVVLIDLTTITEDYMKIIESDAEVVISRLNQMQAQEVPLGKHCQRNDVRQCKFLPICFSKLPKKNSIFVYTNGHHGFKDKNNEKHDRFDLINQGYTDALSIPREWLNREDNVIQRDVIETQETYYDKEKIRAGIKAIKYPIYHLDFESFPCPLPRFKGETPYMQSLFQYSIHVEHEPGVCDKDKDNYSFIATTHDDLREDLVKGMLEVIKEDGGTILVYNVSFEKTRLKELAIIYPQYKERLEDMIERLFDLMDLIKGNQTFYKNLGYSPAKGINYYHNDLNGSYSIKKVLPIFSDLTYEGMAVGNGTQALVTYAKFPYMEKKEFEQSYIDLLEYCKQDTWAMYEILNELRKI